MDGMGFPEALETGANINVIARLTDNCQRRMAKFLHKDRSELLLRFAFERSRLRSLCSATQFSLLLVQECLILGVMYSSLQTR